MEVNVLGVIKEKLTPKCELQLQVGFLTSEVTCNSDLLIGMSAWIVVAVMVHIRAYTD